MDCIPSKMAMTPFRNNSTDTIQMYSSLDSETKSRIAKIVIYDWTDLGIRNVNVFYEKVEKMYSNGDSLYILMRGTKFIGCIGLMDDQLALLFVSPCYRQQGHAKRLLLYGLCKARDIPKVHVWCKKSLVPFYEKLGWKKHYCVPWFFMR
jgi:GNAT superfamily N-acetyltransferase